MYLVTFFLFLAETYHTLSHTIVLFGWRLLPRKDLVGIRTYFLVDAMTAAAAALFITQKYWIIVSLQVAQHLYFYLTWDASSYTKRVIDWSSLNWTDGSRFKWDLVLGTLFDIGVHSMHSYLLGTHLGMKDIVMGLVITHCAIMAVMYNSRLAWATPGQIPAWIQKRVDQSRIGLQKKSE